MRRLFLPGFWVSATGAVAAVAFAAIASQPFVFVIAGVLACFAILMVSAMCWDDVGGKTSLAELLLGKRASAIEAGADLFLDVQSIEVVGVFETGRDLLAQLRGGTGTYRPSGAREPVPWPDDAELFLAWQTTERAASAAARQLNAWEAAHQPLHLLCATACATVLADHENRRLTLPTLSPLGGGGRATHPGRR
ncbi:MAG: hypothetical protein ACYCXN_05430 [Acidimicrobiales bacterium]